MPRLHHRDTREYAMDVIEGAQPIGVQLAAAVGLLTLLLAVMSAVESPLPRQKVAAGTTDAIERALSNEPGLLCSISGMVMNWVTVETSYATNDSVTTPIDEPSS